ncbi:MAG TPA: transposase [Gemmata sp.]
MLDVMNESRRWNLDKARIHVIDREADSVGHYRQWQSRGHVFLVRADQDRWVRWEKRERPLKDVVAGSNLKFEDVRNARGEPEVISIQAGTGRIRIAATEVVLHRPAKKNTGEKTAGGYKRQVEVPGPPIPLRLVMTRVVDHVGKVIAEWCVLTNVDKGAVDAATLGRWYAWRWRIETFHKLLKSAGMNAESWQQETGAAFLRRLCVAAMACVTVWHLQREESEEAVRLRTFLVRLSGRQMGSGVESTAPSLLAGLEKLLAIDDVIQTEDLHEILALARRVLPTLFRSG